VSGAAAQHTGNHALEVVAVVMGHSASKARIPRLSYAALCKTIAEIQGDVPSAGAAETEERNEVYISSLKKV
jgi:hypothetical protein